MKTLELAGAVGVNKPNHHHDVRQVQAHLNKHAHATHIAVSEDGEFGPVTLLAIQAFQRRAMGMTLPNGTVEVFGLTSEWLSNFEKAIEKFLSSFPVPPGQAKSGTVTEQDYKQIASALGCEIAVIKALRFTETGDTGGFDKKGRPTILYERKIFSDLTKHLYDKHYPELSGPHGKGEYKMPSYPKLERAYRLDPEPALESASWGAFQIMGFNFKSAGFRSVGDFVASMRVSIESQRNAFVTFVGSNTLLVRALRAKDWASVALHYNGSTYKKNSYDTKLAAAYLKANQ